jgi:hypothetical protein
MLSIKVRNVLYVLLISGGAVIAQAPAPPAGLPADAGVYYHRGETRWVALTRPVLAETRTAGMEHFLDTYGWSNLNRTIVFQGAAAGIRIPDPKPTFYIRGIGSAQDVLIAQLTARKDSREIRADSTSASVNNKEGFKRGSIYRLTATVLAKDLYSVTPEQNLKPGEYLLVFGHAETSFEFGVQAGPR